MSAQIGVVTFPGTLDDRDAARAVRLAGGASSDPDMAAQAEVVEARLTEGTGLAEAFRGRGLVPD